MNYGHAFVLLLAVIQIAGAVAYHYQGDLPRAVLFVLYGIATGVTVFIK